jgi:hypothetical protein
MGRCCLSSLIEVRFDSINWSPAKISGQLIYTII